MIAPLGTLGLEDAIPGADALATAGSTGITLAIPTLRAQIAACQGFNPQPFSFAVALQQAQLTVQSLQLAISLGLSVPDIGAQIAAMSEQLNALLASLQLVNDQLSIIEDYRLRLSAGTIEAYAYDGALDAAGSDFTAEFSGRPEHANGIFLVATDPIAWLSLGTILKTS
jgi:hypothetical protein